MQRSLVYFLLSLAYSTHAFKQIVHGYGNQRRFHQFALITGPDQASSFLSRAEYLVYLWHSLSTHDQQADLEHSFNLEASAGIYSHIQYSGINGFVPKYKVVDKINSIALEPKIYSDPISDENIELKDVLHATKTWVGAMIADFSICPYTIDESSAGIPRVRFYIL